MISTSIISAYNLLKASVIAANPVASASPLTQAALVSAGNSLCTAIETSRDALTPILDGADPTGFAGAFPQDLVTIANASLDQASLDDLRGSVGRITFNLEQV